MRISIVSHAYLAEENRKNIAALSRRAELCVVVPDRAEDRIFDRVDADPSAEQDGGYRIDRRIDLFGHQYLLASTDLGFRGFRPDLVNIEYDPWSAIFWQALACRNVFAPGARIVCTVKNNTYRRYPGLVGTIKSDLARSGIRRVDAFIAASRMVANLYRDQFGVDESRLRVITHLAVDTERFAPGEASPGGLGPSATAGAGSGPVIGYCGRLDPDKGVRELIEAVVEVRSRVSAPPNLELLGNGTLREELLRRAAAEPWLTIREPVPHAEVPAFLRGLDLFVLPALVSDDHEEHDAHALMEALAVGLPCIGTRSGIIPEMLDDGSGLLIEANSTPALASAIETLALDPALRRELASRARSRALRSFSLEAVAAARAELYQEVLRNGE